MKKITLILLASLFVLFGCGSNYAMQTSYGNDAVTSQNTSQNQHANGNKVYKVGTDMPEGEYYITPINHDTTSYFAISSDFDGLNVYYDTFFTEQSYATVSDGQYLILDNALATPINQTSPITSTIGDGIYKVGRDLVPGMYRLTPQSNKMTTANYFVVYSDSSYQNILTSGKVNANQVGYIIVNEGEYLALDNVYAVMTN